LCKAYFVRSLKTDSNQASWPSAIICDGNGTAAPGDERRRQETFEAANFLQWPTWPTWPPRDLSLKSTGSMSAKKHLAELADMPPRKNRQWAQMNANSFYLRRSAFIRGSKTSSSVVLALPSRF